MVSDIKRTRFSNGILVNKDRNCSKMTAGNTSGRGPHQCNISTAIEGWVLVYWEVGKGKVISEYRLSRMS